MKGLEELNEWTSNKIRIVKKVRRFIRFLSVWKENNDIILVGKIWYSIYVNHGRVSKYKEIYVWSYPHNNISSDLLSVSGNYVISLCYVKLNLKIKYVCKKREHRREEDSRMNERNFERFFKGYLLKFFFFK